MRSTGSQITKGKGSAAGLELEDVAFPVTVSVYHPYDTEKLVKELIINKEDLEDDIYYFRSSFIRSLPDPTGYYELVIADADGRFRILNSNLAYNKEFDDFPATNDKPASVAYTVTLANPKWTGDLVLSSKLTLVKEFTLKPECSTIQLNTRLADRLDGVDAERSIRVNKSYMEVQDLVFSGKNAAAEQALNQGLSLTFDKDTQTVKATLARDYTMKPGTYTYLMTGHVGRSLASTPAKAQKLTIKILDGAKAQTGISLKAKGSIDLLDREQSKIVYTPSFKNMTAKLTDATFASRDPNKDLFDLSVENGKVVLQAKSGVELSTRQTYQVRMLLILNNRYTGSVTVKVKPTAKYPKIKVTPAKTTLYKGTESRLQAAVTLTGKTNAAIKDVTLDQDKAGAYANFDLTYENGKVLLSMKDQGSTLTAGKTYKLTLLVSFEGEAEDAVPKKATVSVTVR